MCLPKNKKINIRVFGNELIFRILCFLTIKLFVYHLYGQDPGRSHFTLQISPMSRLRCPACSKFRVTLQCISARSSHGLRINVRWWAKLSEWRSWAFQHAVVAGVCLPRSTAAYNNKSPILFFCYRMSAFSPGNAQPFWLSEEPFCNSRFSKTRLYGCFFAMS